MNHECKYKDWNDFNEENISKVQELIAGTNSSFLVKDATAKTITELYEIQDFISKSDRKCVGEFKYKLDKLRRCTEAQSIRKRAPRAYYLPRKRHPRDGRRRNRIYCQKCKPKDLVTISCTHFSGQRERAKSYRQQPKQTLAILLKNYWDLIHTGEAASAKIFTLISGTQKMGLSGVSSELALLRMQSNSTVLYCSKTWLHVLSF